MPTAALGVNEGPEGGLHGLGAGSKRHGGLCFLCLILNAFVL